MTKMIVVATRSAADAYQYYVVLTTMGYAVRLVDEPAQVLTCLVDPNVVLLIVEDGFVPKSSAHGFIETVRSAPGKLAQIPIIRIWTGPVNVTGQSLHPNSVLTIRSPATSIDFYSAMRELKVATTNRIFL